MGKQRYNNLRPSPRPVVNLKMTPAYLAVLDFMQDYDVIPSSYVRAHFPHRASAKKMLGELCKAHLVGVSKGYAHFNALYRPRPLELTSLGRRALADAGRLR